MSPLRVWGRLYIKELKISTLSRHQKDFCLSTHPTSGGLETPSHRPVCERKGRQDVIWRWEDWKISTRANLTADPWNSFWFKSLCPSRWFLASHSSLLTVSTSSGVNLGKCYLHDWTIVRINAKTCVNPHTVLTTQSNLICSRGDNDNESVENQF